MTQPIRVITDDTTVAELIECMGHRPRGDWDACRETMIDSLWREVLERRGRG